MPREASSPGWIRGFLNIYHPIPTGTGAVEIVTDISPALRYWIEKVTALVTVVVGGVAAGSTYAARGWLRARRS